MIFYSDCEAGKSAYTAFDLSSLIDITALTNYSGVSSFCLFPSYFPLSNEFNMDFKYLTLFYVKFWLYHVMVVSFAGGRNLINRTVAGLSIKGGTRYFYLSKMVFGTTWLKRVLYKILMNTVQILMINTDCK